MLVLVAMLLFGLMAIAALTIDIGLARFTQAKMQAAADLGALEGLRGSRADASALVAATYDPDRLLSVGPGMTELHAGALLEVSPDTYVPQLETNDGDEPHGDMVGGSYDPAAAHGESAYVRADFTAGAGGALLVRLRRTGGSSPLDDQAGISSFGPTLPLLFGRGTALHGDDPDDPDAYSVRRDGFTVRATAIADLRPVVVAGHPVAAPATPGVARVALRAAAWSALPFDLPQALDADAGGVVRDASTAIVGVAYVDVATSPLRYGDALVADAALAAHAFAAEERWLPLYAPVTGAGDRVVGFGRVELTGTIPGAFTLTKRAGGVAHANASAARTVALPADLDTAAEVAELDAARAALVAAPADVLTAPVLVR